MCWNHHICLPELANKGRNLSEHYRLQKKVRCWDTFREKIQEDLKSILHVVISLLMNQSDCSSLRHQWGKTLSSSTYTLHLA